MSSIPLLSTTEAAAALSAQRAPHHAGYFSFYSNTLGGIVTNPALMLVPADDHLVHRGDGIFETLKCVEGGIYLWREHIQRLFHSAQAIALTLPWTPEQLADITAQTIRASGKRDCLIRLIVSRGPGSLGVNPYDCPAPGLYILVYESKPSFMDAHPGGARAITSAIPVKSGIFATIKTCNYLPNALLKKEAADADADFAIAFDEQGYVAEGATENFGIVDANKILRVPEPARILAGTTMNRALELAAALVADGRLRKIEHSPISRADLNAAPEVLIFGTTPDVTAVVSLDGKPVADGKPGPISIALLTLLRHDIHHNPDTRLALIP